MGDSSECFGTSTSRLSIPTDIKYMDNVSDSEDDEALKKSTFSSDNKTYLNGTLKSTPGDVCIQIEDLNSPVPVCPDTDASCSDTNGLEENCLLEPKISESETLGREANGFDEAAEVEGSDEEVRTGSPTGSDAWVEENFSDDETSQGFDHRPTQMLFSHCSMTSSNDYYSSKTHPFTDSGSANPHQRLYSGGKQYEMKEFEGRGENSALYNYSPHNSLRTIDTYQDSASSHRPLSTKSEIDEPVSFKLQSPGLSTIRQYPRTNYQFASPSNPRTPLPSSCSPSVSGSSARTILPYETSVSPPLGNPVDESKIRRSAVNLLSPRGISSEAPYGMPRGEVISFDDNDPEANCSSAEGSKKKKKKKKRSGHKSGDTEPEKKNEKNLPPSGVTILDKAVTDPVHESRAQHYPPPNDCGASVMENPHRSKAKHSGKNKKKTEVKSYPAKDIDGNRGCEDITTLLSFVEGKKPQPSKSKSASIVTTAEPKKKQKKQKVVTRTVANSSSFDQGKSTPIIMGSVIEENVVLPLEENICVDSSTISTSDSGLLSIDGSGIDSLVSPKVDGSGDQTTVHVETPDIPIDPTESNCGTDKQADVSSHSESVSVEPVLKEEVRESAVKVSTKKSSHTEPPPSAVAGDLEFTNFEGLVDQYTEQPFEKYVGRKKKQRQPQQQSTQQFRQAYTANSSRGRWQPSNQPNNVHVNNSRVQGNGVGHASHSSHSQAGATNKLSASQSVGRPPASSTSQSFAAKASTSRTPQQPPPLSHDQSRKSTGSSATSPPPQQEEFPPLRPSATDAQTLKKEVSPTSATSSPVPSKNSGSASSRDPNPVVHSAAAVPFDRVNVLKIQQFLEMIYPKQNEPCYFYSEDAKRYHFLKVSAKEH